MCPYHLCLALFPGYSVKLHPTWRGMSPGSVLQDTPHDHDYSLKGLQGNAYHQVTMSMTSPTGMKSVILSRTPTSGSGSSLQHEAKGQVWVGVGVPLGREDV